MLKIFDNEGQTLDRFTILDTTTGDLYGASENPFHGFGQHCGNVAQHYFGNTWYRADPKELKKKIKYSVEKFTEEFPDKQVRIAELPEAVKEYVKVLRSYE